MTQLHIARVLLPFMCVWLGVPRVDGLAANSYYSSPGTSATTCTVTPCSYAACQNWQYLSGCSFNLPGVCTQCTNTPAAGYYYSGTGQFSATGCQTSPWTICGAGFTLSGNTVNAAGTCTACAPPAEKHYFTTAGSCATLPWASCTTGNTNPSGSTTSAGGCVPCTNPALTKGNSYTATAQYSTAATCAITACVAPAVGSYFTTVGSCALASSACPAGQANPSATTVSAGTCVTCTNPTLAAGVYFTATPQINLACATTACTGLGANKFWNTPGTCLEGSWATCAAGQTNPTASTTSAGQCAPCAAPSSGYYFTTAGTCSQGSWAPCGTGFTNPTASTLSAGVCEACTNLAATNGYIYTATPQYTNKINCAVTACAAPAAGSYFTTAGSCAVGSMPTCSAGQTNPSATTVFIGVCEACSNPTLAAGVTYAIGQQYLPTCATTACTGLGATSYWSTPGSCAQLSWLTCATGSKNSGKSTTSAGTCGPCPVSTAVYYTSNTDANSNCPSSPCLSDCGVGLYRKNCGGVTPTGSGTCTACTTATTLQQYTTTGGLTDTCQVVGCTKVCLTGQYINGCGGAEAGVTCQSCTNSVANVNYYTGPGAYTAGSCPTASCPTFSNGYYNLGCYGTSQGVATACTN